MGRIMGVRFDVPKVDKKIIAIDFDGTILNNRYPVIENPRTEVIDFIQRNRKRFVWILWTCRTGERLQEAVDYMRDEHGIKFDYVNENTRENISKWGQDCRKVFADYYVDDRNERLFEIEGAR